MTPTLRKLASDYRAAEARHLDRKDRLYAAIREEHAAGRSVRDIGREVGLSAARVHKICNP